MIYEVQILTWVLINRRVYDFKGVTYGPTFQVGYKGKNDSQEPSPPSPKEKKKCNCISHETMLF